MTPAPKPSLPKPSFSSVLTMGGLLVAVFVVDLVVPPGYAPWTLYVLAVAAALMQNDERTPLVVAMLATLLMILGFALKFDLADDEVRPMAAANRTAAIVGCWVMAAVILHVIRMRNRAAESLWLQKARGSVAKVLLGEQSAEEIGRNASGALARLFGADVGVLYRLDGASLVRVGGYALDEEKVALRIGVGEGIAGQVAADATARVVDPVPDDHLPVRSALGASTPSRLVVAPVLADGRVAGVVELGSLDPALDADRVHAVFDVVGEAIGVALRSAHYREQLVALLEETQRQSEELQVQQEELRVSNEEFEEQSRVLEASQARLETQQSELEHTNMRLEEQAQQLQRQKAQLLDAQQALLEYAAKLESANRYKTDFLANMSHELRTPLNSALILASLLAENRDGNLSPEQVRYARAIHASNSDLLALINDVLDLAKIEAGHVELHPGSVEMSVLLERLRATFEPLASEKSLELRIDAEPDVPPALVTDSLRLAQILKNLLSNAVKFTERGRVHLRVSMRAGERLAFEVHDTGIGVPREQLLSIFEAFHQGEAGTSRRFGGTGLGLSISRELARRLGGDIEAQSEPGRGSVFTLVLPLQWNPPAEAGLGSAVGPSLSSAASTRDAGAAALAFPSDVPALAIIDARRASAPATAAVAMRAAAAQGGHASEPAPSDTESAAGEHEARAAGGPEAAVVVHDDRSLPRRHPHLVLCVEDDAAFAQVLVDLAHEQGFDCVVAGNAADALQATAQLQPDAILLDIGLPDQSGLTVLERLKRDPATRHIPVHVVSMHDRAHTARELGAVGFLHKPATREQIEEAFGRIEQRLRRSVRRLLIVEDDAQLRANLEQLLGGERIEVVQVGCIADALRELDASTFDCMVMDLTLPDGSGYDLLERIAAREDRAFPPVIVYTGRALAREDEERLRRYSHSIIVKGARSPERLLDEVTLFLHSVESSLPDDQRKLLRQARRRDAVLDGRRILLAEDDVRNIFALSSVFEPLGVKLEIARNGREALEKLDAQPGIELVLMDIMMPEMDGLTAIRRMRADPRWAEVPVIALTAKAMSDDRERCLDAGANDYVAKPIAVDKLVSLCRVWIPK
ncbi:MAG: response regulator [Burkholderiaceae bacterium]|nr:response regulator [Burkholderiaceae bacterium]